MTLLLMIGANMISFSFRFSRNEPTFPLCNHCETADALKASFCFWTTEYSKDRDSFV